MTSSVQDKLLMWKLSEPDIALNDRNEPISDILKLVYLVSTIQKSPHANDIEKSMSGKIGSLIH